MGIQEAVYFGVPVVGIPIFADQPRNIAGVVAKGMAVSINYLNITTEVLDEALTEILTQPKYRYVFAKVSDEIGFLYSQLINMHVFQRKGEILLKVVQR